MKKVVISGSRLLNLENNQPRTQGTEGLRNRNEAQGRSVTFGGKLLQTPGWRNWNKELVKRICTNINEIKDTIGISWEWLVFNMTFRFSPTVVFGLRNSRNKGPLLCYGRNDRHVFSDTFGVKTCKSKVVTGDVNGFHRRNDHRTKIFPWYFEWFPGTRDRGSFVWVMVLFSSHI